MSLDGIDGNNQCFGDFRITAACDQQGKHTLFLRGERLKQG
jgi:hypothetical protein